MTPTPIRTVDDRSRRALCANASTKGAARFGWDKRTPELRSMRDGRYLIGQVAGGGDLHALAMARKGAGHNKRRRIWRWSKPPRMTSALVPLIQ